MHAQPEDGMRNYVQQRARRKAARVDLNVRQLLTVNAPSSMPVCDTASTIGRRVLVCVRDPWHPHVRSGPSVSSSCYCE